MQSSSNSLVICRAASAASVLPPQASRFGLSPPEGEIGSHWTGEEAGPRVSAAGKDGINCREEMH